MPPPSRVSRIQAFLSAWLGLDLRSLALLRICLGAVVLQDLLIRLPNLTAHYTDSGICTRAAMIGRYPNGGWSLHMASGGWGPEFFLFCVQAFCALAFMVGYRTFWANALTWILLVSLHHRNLAVFDCGDFYLRMLLLWGLFLPLGRRWSLDALATSVVDPPQPADNRWFGMGAIAYPAQITIVYVFAALWKNDPVWHQTHTAVYLALSLLTFASPRASWLLNRPDWMAFLTVATFRFEMYGPILLWLPGLFRLLGIVGIFSLHLGLGIFIHLGIFPVIGMAAPLGLLPGFVWDRSPLRFTGLSKIGKAILRRLPWFFPRRPSRGPSPHFSKSWLVCLALLTTVIIGNIKNLPTHVGYDQAWNQAERALGLDQCWNMFAPHPPGVDGWYVIDATKCDGSHFDLFATLYGEHQDLTWEKPRFVASTFPDARWRKLMEYMREETCWRLPYCLYLSRLWNLKHGEQEDKIYSFELYFMQVATPPLGEPRAEPEKVLLWKHQCYPRHFMLPGGKVLGSDYIGNDTHESIMQNSDY